MKDVYHSKSETTYTFNRTATVYFSALKNIPKAVLITLFMMLWDAEEINTACQKPVDLGYAAETWTYAKLTEHIHKTIDLDVKNLFLFWQVFNSHYCNHSYYFLLAYDDLTSNLLRVTFCFLSCFWTNLIMIIVISHFIFLEIADFLMLFVKT